MGFRKWWLFHFSHPTSVKSTNERFSHRLFYQRSREQFVRPVWILTFDRNRCRSWLKPRSKCDRNLQLPAGLRQEAYTGFSLYRLITIGQKKLPKCQKKKDISKRWVNPRTLSLQIRLKVYLTWSLVIQRANTLLPIPKGNILLLYLLSYN